MNKDDTSQNPPAAPHGFGPAGSAGAQAKGRLLEETAPGERAALQHAAPLSQGRRRQDREAGPSEKQVYVPPVTLPPNKEPQAPDSRKIMVAASVMVTSDERSRPTMRRIPVPTGAAGGAAPAYPQGEGQGSRTAGGRAARFDGAPGAQQPPHTSTLPSVGATPQRSQRTLPTGALAYNGTSTARMPATASASSPWAKGGVGQIDKANLPSSQLLSTTAPIAKSQPASADATGKDRSATPRPLLARVLLLAGLAGVAAVTVWYLLRWPPPKDSAMAPPLEVGVSTPSPAGQPPATAPIAPPPDTAAIAQPPATAAIAQPPTVAPPEPPPPVRPSPPVESLPSTTPTRKPPRPTSTGDAATAPKATATAAPAVEPPPKPTTSAPPRPF